MDNKNMKQKFLNATKNILEKNLKILEKPYSENKVILVYDLDSPLSREISEWYIENLKNNKNSEIINFNQINKEKLQKKLLELKENSSIILVQSSNFRIENFRIRMTLHKMWIWCLEHNHLKYILDNQIENYADAIEYKTPYYDKLSEKLKYISDSSNQLKIISKDKSELIFSWGFEDMKQNTGNYEWKNRGGTFPIWENFTEILDFKKANWKVWIRAFPNEKLQVEFPEVFYLDIKESLVVWYSENTPKYFIEILEKIKKSEDGEIYLRELWFGLNNWITWEKPLSDVNAFERIAGFHMSLWKKHWIYRKKFWRKITQRFHIDIFVDTDKIFFDEKLIFENEKFVI